MKLRLLRFLERLFYRLGDYFEDQADSVDFRLLATIQNGISEIDTIEPNWEAEAILGEHKWARLDSKESWEVKDTQLYEPIEKIIEDVLEEHKEAWEKLAKL